MLTNVKTAASLQRLVVFNQNETKDNVFRIDMSKLSEVNVGFYTIRVTAAFTNGTYTAKP